MVAMMLMSVALIAVLCIVAYTFAVYALPLMLGLTVARFAYEAGSGLIGAGLVGLVAAAVGFGLLALLFDTLRQPILRLIVALIFAVPAAVAGYALVHGITREVFLLKSGGKSSASSVGDLSVSRL